MTPGYNNGLTMTAVIEDGAEGASVWALCELQYGRTHFVTPLYSRWCHVNSIQVESANQIVRALVSLYGHYRPVSIKSAAEKLEYRNAVSVRNGTVSLNGAELK